MQRTSLFLLLLATAGSVATSPQSSDFQADVLYDRLVLHNATDETLRFTVERAEPPPSCGIVGRTEIYGSLEWSEAESWELGPRRNVTLTRVERDCDAARLTLADGTVRIAHWNGELPLTYFADGYARLGDVESGAIVLMADPLDPVRSSIGGVVSEEPEPLGTCPAGVQLLPPANPGMYNVSHVRSTRGCHDLTLYNANGKDTLAWCGPSALQPFVAGDIIDVQFALGGVSATLSVETDAEAPKELELQIGPVRRWTGIELDPSGSSSLDCATTLDGTCPSFGLPAADVFLHGERVTLPFDEAFRVHDFDGELWAALVEARIGLQPCGTGLEGVTLVWR